VRQRSGRDPSDEEVAAEMGLRLGEYQAVLVEIAGIRLLQIDAIDEDDNHFQAAETQDSGLDRSRMLALLAHTIAALPEREKLVMSLYYEHELNMDEVGKVLGIDKATVSRAHGRALLILRGALAGEAATKGAALRRRAGG
jgi:RNA polymerase sigma factor for flagellar operon FliA